MGGGWGALVPPFPLEINSGKSKIIRTLIFGEDLVFLEITTVPAPEHSK